MHTQRNIETHALKRRQLKDNNNNKKKQLKKPRGEFKQKHSIWTDKPLDYN